jgi:LPPG:FO 2-phospho-L-lactate transferase
MKIAALAGGVGGSKLLVGLDEILDGSDLTAIVNTGDDAVIYGVHVSPDIDIVTYWLAQVNDEQRGWGLKGDTFHMIDALQRFGTDTWFGLGDKDLATCLYRTQQLRAGASLTTITDDIRISLGVEARILPMSDDPVPTRIVTEDGRTLEFQEYFVKEAHEPAVREVRFSGMADAKPAPGVLDAIRRADRVILCPSNPVVSIGPILALPEVRDTLREHPYVMAVSPIVAGAPLKGPADKLIPTIGAEVSASGVAGLYKDFCDVFVVDEKDPNEIERVEALGIKAVALDTVMSDRAASTRVAKQVLGVD